MKKEKAVHPGELIKDLLRSLDLSEEQLSYELKVDVSVIHGLIIKEQSLNEDIASKLAKYLGTPASIWLSMQKAYDEENKIA